MANMLMSIRPEIKKSSSLSEMAELTSRFREHSVFKRIEGALAAGKDELEFYRPNASAVAEQTTTALLSLMGMMGMTVRRVPCSPFVALYVITDLKSWKV